MKILFMHNNFPAQFRRLAQVLAADPANRVGFITQNDGGGELANVVKLPYQPTRAAHAETHAYVRPFEQAVLTAQGAYRVMRALKERGFAPDVVVAHAGWGPGLFIKDIFPECRHLGYFEWYYHARDTDSNFLDPAAVTEDVALRVRARNAAMLFDLVQCDHGICPTLFQRDQVPPLFHDKLTVLHDGIDTDYFRPLAGRPADAGLVLPDLNLAGVREIVTYATRGMEPYRGFPQFMRAAALLLRRRPDLHVVVVGTDRVAYGPQPADGKGYRQRLLEELPDLDLRRLHFTGLLPYGQYLQVLQASSAHVYLTVPFVLSWSVLEALSAGCLVVGSDTPPLHEVMRDGENGLLVDFFDHAQLADRITWSLEHPVETAALRQAARASVVERYAMRDLLPRQVALIGALAAGRLPGGDAGA